MRATIALLYPVLLLAAAPAIAAEPDEPDKPVTDRSPSMGDAAATPVSDLNLRKGEIPPLLISAQERPYHLGGLERCNQIAGAIRDLDQLLGDDLDLPQEDGQRVTAGRVAQAAVGSFIPFRGLIREVSGANTHEGRLQAANDGGKARRALPKGAAEGAGRPRPRPPAPPGGVRGPIPTGGGCRRGWRRGSRAAPSSRATARRVAAATPPALRPWPSGTPGSPPPRLRRTRARTRTRKRTTVIARRSAEASSPSSFHNR